MIAKVPFGQTGHSSTRTLFGAAALGKVDQKTADSVLDLLLEYGVNHIDVAARYGDAELRIAPWMKSHRKDFFLATKTAERSYQGAMEGIKKSLERLGTDSLDLIQLHNCVELEEWEQAFSPGGALEALVDARSQGMVRFIGITGHGFGAPARHLQSLTWFPFDSVLFPYNWFLCQNTQYAIDIENLLELCVEKGIAVQTIKSLACRPWPGERRYSCWYEPLEEQGEIQYAVNWVLGDSRVFLNTTGDVNLLPKVLKAASETGERPAEDTMRALAKKHEMEPIFDGNTALMRP